MNKEFVPYELALKLKQLGFDKPSLANWIEKDSREGGGIKLEIWNDEDTIFEVKSWTKAPTFSQAFRWFREKYKLHTEIRSYTAKYFTIIIQECKDIVRYIEYGGIDLKFNTYEEAELACLTKLIEIVESKSE